MAIKRNRNLYFSYKDYTKRFGTNRRPALVRCSIEQENNWYGNNDDQLYLKHHLFIDGVSETASERISDDTVSYPPYLVIVEPFQSNDRDLRAYNMVGKPFNASSGEDWFILLWDTKEFDRRFRDPMAFAHLAIALDKWEVNVRLLAQVLQRFQGDDQQALLRIIEYIGWSLSQKKITLIKELLRLFGKNSPICFPQDLIVAGQALGVDNKELSAHKYANKVMRKVRDEKNTSSGAGILQLAEWLLNDGATIPIEKIERYHPYVSEDLRNTILKRYFFDVKRGAATYDKSLQRLFSAQNYQYYPLLRYVYESFPDRRRVEAEFFIDCLTTYEKTNQQQFQVSDGVLDWAVRKSIEKNRPIDLNFSQWLGVCEGGVITNPDFFGLAEFVIKYEIDEMLFEEPSLEASVKDLLARYCTQRYHYENEPVIDPRTRQQAIDPQTRQPMTRQVAVKDPVWEYQEQNKELIDIFVKWEAENDLPGEKNTFGTEQICLSQVEQKVREYCIRYYGQGEIWIPLSKKDPIIPMFAMRVRMKAKLRDDVKLGKDPGVDLPLVKERIKKRLEELFGEQFECDYDPQLLAQAQMDTLYNPQKKNDTIFISKHQYYRRSYRYCAPKLADFPNLLTGRKCAICQSDMCFMTSLKKNPEWKDYKLLHVLDIIGYPALEQTEAGVIPSEVYTRFVAQVNKALWFYRLLTCKECGHILFPSKRAHKYKCLFTGCSQYDKDVYLNWCHECKTGIIDSRETKQCPNGWYICPRCNSCCSDQALQGLVIRRQHQGLAIPAALAAAVGKGHAERHMVFCYKCGAQKIRVNGAGGGGELICPNCDNQPGDDAPPPPPDLEAYFA